MANRFTLRQSQIFVLLRPGFLVGMAILLGSIALALFPSFFAPFDPNAFNYSDLKQPPSAEHWFGTDNLGRDTFSRVIWAYSVNIQMAFVATIFALVLGVIVGSLVGYYGGIATRSLVVASTLSSRFHFWF